MITRVQIRNFRSIGNVDVSLENLTLLVGRNGAGKSAFIDALRFLADALQSGLNKAIDERGGIARLRKWDGTSRNDITITVHFRDQYGSDGIDREAECSYSVTLQSLPENKWQVKDEACRLDAGSVSERWGFHTNNGVWVEKLEGEYSLFDTPLNPRELTLPKVALINRNFARLEFYLKHIRCYSVFPSDMLRRPQLFYGDHLLEENGENLAVQLAGISDGRLHSTLQSILGDVDQFKVDMIGEDGYFIIRLRHTSPNLPWYELSQESDGTLRVLALLTALYQAELPFLLAIDEPELHLHPGTFRAMAEAIKEASERTQVLISTQSPDFITEFDPESLRIVEKRRGETYIGKIEAYQLAAINKELFTTGDLLRIEELKINGTSNRGTSPDDENPSNR